MAGKTVQVWPQGKQGSGAKVRRESGRENEKASRILMSASVTHQVAAETKAAENWPPTENADGHFFLSLSSFPRLAKSSPSLPPPPPVSERACWLAGNAVQES